MGFVQRFRQRRQTLKQIRKRAEALLPLCEEAAGIKLKGTLMIEATSKWKLRFRYIMDLLKGPSSEEKNNEQTGAFYDPVFSFMLGIALRKLITGRFEAAYGYYDPKRSIIGVNLGRYVVGDAESDYTIAHEIVHLLIRQRYPQEQVNKNSVLAEGAATFYGSNAILKVHPSFDVKDSPSFKGNYKTGYEFFEAIALVVSDPLLMLSTVPPVKCVVQSRYSSHSYLDDETGHPAKYVERIRRRALSPYSGEAHPERLLHNPSYILHMA